MKRNIIILARLFLFFTLFLLQAGTQGARAQTISLVEVRFSSTPQKFKIVLDLTGAPRYKTRLQGNVLSLLLDETELKWDVSNVQTGDASVNKIDVLQSPAKTQCELKINLAYSMPYRVYKLVDPDRLVVDVMKYFEEKTILIMDSAIEFSEVRRSNENGLLSYYLLRFSPSQEPYRLVPVLANSFFSREKLSALVQKNAAEAGLNGGFFSKEGKPLGLVAVDGVAHSENLFHRSCLLEKKNGQFSVENIELEILARFDEGKTLKIDGLNRERKDTDIILYTPAFGPSTKTNVWGKEILVVDNVVQEKNMETNNTLIPPKGFVFSLGAKRTEYGSFFEAGKKVKVEFLLKPSGDFKNALCAGPRLIKEGAISVSSKEEQFKPDVANGRAPRTAVGITKDGELLMVVVDGRNAQKSKGVTLSELAQLLLKLGAYSAVNLDGGGSSTMVVGDMIVNSPSDGTERKITTALLLFKENGETGNEDSAWFSEIFLKQPLPIPIFSEGR